MPTDKVPFDEVLGATAEGDGEHNCHRRHNHNSCRNSNDEAEMGTLFLGLRSFGSYGNNTAGSDLGRRWNHRLSLNLGAFGLQSRGSVDLCPKHLNASPNLLNPRMLRVRRQKQLKGLKRHVVLTEAVGCLADVVQQARPTAQLVGGLKALECLAVSPFAKRRTSRFEKMPRPRVADLRGSFDRRRFLRGRRHTSKEEHRRSEDPKPHAFLLHDSQDTATILGTPLNCTPHGMLAGISRSGKIASHFAPAVLGSSAAMDRATARKTSKILQSEVARAMSELHIEGHPKPYFLSHLLRHDEELRFEAKFGALLTEKRETRRNAFVDVRVGNYRRDQVRSGGLRDNNTELESYELVRQPIGGQPDGLRHALWRLTEAKYREACDDHLQRRAVELNYLDEHHELPDFEKRKGEIATHWQELPEVDAAAWQDFVTKASAAFKRYPRIKDGYVRYSALDRVRIFASSEGSVIIQSQPIRSIEIYLWYLSEDGFSIPQTHSWLVTDPAELPDLKEAKKVLAALHKRCEAVAAAPRLRSYVGPVLLDPRPAGLMIHEALGHRLEGNRLLSSGEGQTFRDAIGEEILPAGITVRDDPTLTHYDGKSLVGSYAYDDEGVPSENAELIVDGVLKDFLRSRTPISKKHKSNGHGRAAYHERPISRMGVTVVDVNDGLDDDALFRRFVEEIQAQKVPYGIRIIEAYGGETKTESYDFQAFLGEIDLAARVYPDGRQELVRGVDFVGTPLNAVRGIVAAGNRSEVDNGYCGAESGYVPVSTVSPALLIDELELQSKPERPMTQHAYGMPWEEKAPKKRPAKKAAAKKPAKKTAKKAEA